LVFNTNDRLDIGHSFVLIRKFYQFDSRTRHVWFSLGFAHLRPFRYNWKLLKVALIIRVIKKLPNTEQSSKGKGKTHKSTNRQNQSTTGKLGKPQCPWIGTGICNEMVGWIRFYGAKPPASITGKRFRLSL
jgi:hypothetical protein